MLTNTAEHLLHAKRRLPSNVAIGCGTLVMRLAKLRLCSHGPSQTTVQRTPSGAQQRHHTAYQFLVSSCKLSVTCQQGFQFSKRHLQASKDAQFARPFALVCPVHQSHRHKGSDKNVGHVILHASCSSYFRSQVIHPSNEQSASRAKASLYPASHPKSGSNVRL